MSEECKGKSSNWNRHWRSGRGRRGGWRGTRRRSLFISISNESIELREALEDSRSRRSGEGVGDHSRDAARRRRDLVPLFVMSPLLGRKMT
jgi:hypothetical protein